MEELKSLGRLLDEYLTEYPGYETIVLSHDRNANPIVVVTQTDQDYDFTEVFTEVVDLRNEIAVKKKEVEALQARIRSLKREQTSVESAIKRIAKHLTK